MIQKTEKSEFNNFLKEETEIFKELNGVSSISVIVDFFHSEVLDFIKKNSF